MDLVNFYLETKTKFGDEEIETYLMLFRIVSKLMRRTTEKLIFEMSRSLSLSTEEFGSQSKSPFIFDHFYSKFTDHAFDEARALICECVQVLLVLFSSSEDVNAFATEVVSKIEISGKLILAVQTEIRILLGPENFQNKEEIQKHILKTYFEHFMIQKCELEKKCSNHQNDEFLSQKSITLNRKVIQNKSGLKEANRKKYKSKNERKNEFLSNEELVGMNRVQSEWEKTQNMIRKLEIGTDSLFRFEKKLKMISNFPEKENKTVRSSKVKLSMPTSNINTPIKEISNDDPREEELKKEAEKNLESFLND